MALICTEVKDDLLTFFTHVIPQKFVHATTDRESIPELRNSFPSDHEFLPCVMPSNYADLGEEVLNFDVRPDDIWIISMPRSGSTWMQNIVQYLQNDMDLTAPPLTPFHALIEIQTMFDMFKFGIMQILNQPVSTLDALPSPRIIKSHLPVHLLPKQIWTVKPKIIYMARNPKDVAVSMYRMYYKIFLNPIKCGIREFFEMFMKDITLYGPFHEHILDFWQLRHLDNILFVTYEELSRDPFKMIKTVSQYLNCKHSDNQLEVLTTFMSFGTWSKRLNTSMSDIKLFTLFEPTFKFCRKGKVGGFEEDMSDDIVQRFNEWTKEKLKDSDFKFTA